jgi:hypothetical protein
MLFRNYETQENRKKKKDKETKWEPVTSISCLLVNISGYIKKGGNERLDRNNY